jgi:hypothetical protein
MDCLFPEDEVTGVNPLTEADWLGDEIELTEADLLPLADDDTARILLELDPFQASSASSKAAASGSAVHRHW